MAGMSEVLQKSCHHWIHSMGFAVAFLFFRIKFCFSYWKHEAEDFYDKTNSYLKCAIGCATISWWGDQHELEARDQVSSRPIPAERVVDARMRLKWMERLSWDKPFAMFCHGFLVSIHIDSNHFYLFPRSVHNAAGFSREREREGEYLS